MSKILLAHGLGGGHALLDVLQLSWRCRGLRSERLLQYYHNIMSRRITRSQSRSRSRSMSASAQDVNTKSKPSKKRPKKKIKLDPVAEATDVSNVGAALQQNTSFESRVRALKTVLNANDSLHESSDAATDAALESLLNVCTQLKEDMKAESETWTDGFIKVELQDTLGHSLIECAGDRIDSCLKNSTKKSNKRKKAKNTDKDVDKGGVLSWLPGLFALALRCAIQGHVSGRIPFEMLDNVLHTQTISMCEKIWDLVESMSEAISNETLVPSDGRNINSKLWLLRVANNLLKRLSTTQNSFFCGRISFFLARIFPLSEKSALNLTKKRNLANVTTFNSEEVFNEVAHKNNSINEQESAPKISYNCYSNFWKLQHEFLRDPSKILKGPAVRNQFLQKVNGVLELFAKHPLPQGDKIADDGGATDVGNLSTIEEDSTQQFSAVKYLTAARLFRLQLIDPQLRRHVMCQILIVLEEIRFYGENLKKSEYQKIARCRQDVLKSLCSTTPNGKAFADAVVETLKGCVKWKLWKYNKKCPSFERFLDPNDNNERAAEKKEMLIEINSAKEKATGISSKDAISRRRAKAATTIQPALKKFWVGGNNDAESFDLVSHCAANEEIKDLKVLYQKVVDAEDPVNEIEDIYHPKHDKVYCWKSLRLTASKQFDIFQKLDDGSVVSAAQHLGYVEAKTSEAESAEKGMDEDLENSISVDDVKKPVDSVEN